MKKKIAIIQPNYIPWKGYFDIINTVDEFILYDDTQYTQRDWRNRNQIKVPHGLAWLTIPVNVKGLFYQQIKDVTVVDPTWGKKHWKTIVHNYSKAQYFPMFKELFEELYLNIESTKFLGEINFVFIEKICNLLGIKTALKCSSDFALPGNRTERLVNLCKQANANHYLTGPSAKNYLEENLFEQENIKIEYIDYSGYSEYTQLHNPFIHEVSIIDLIFNEGPNSPKFMKSFNYAQSI